MAHVFRFTILLIVLFSNSSFSSSVYLGMWSQHFYWDGMCNGVECSEDATPNSNNNLIMFEHNGYEIGTFKNSYSDQTYIIAKQFDLTTFKNINIRYHIGLDYGYHNWMFNTKIKEKTLLRPVTILEIAYSKYKIEPVLFYFGNGVALSFRYKL